MDIIYFSDIEVFYDKRSDREKINKQWSELFNAFGWTKKTVVIFKSRSSNYLSNHSRDTFSVLTTMKKSKKHSLHRVV